MNSSIHSSMNSSSIADEWNNNNTNITPPSNNDTFNVSNDSSSNVPSSAPTVDFNWSSWDVNTSNTSNTSSTTIIIVQGSSEWVGYLFGVLCAGAAIVFVLFWYLDRRRHLEFVGDRRQERRRRRRQRRNRRRRRILGMITTSSTSSTDGGHDDTAMADRDEEYILSMLATKTAQIQQNYSLTVNEKRKALPDFFVLDDDMDCCPICLNDYAAGEEVCFSKNRTCQHEFHRSCLVQWLTKHYHCPLCRVNYLGDEEAEEASRDGGVEENIDDESSEGAIDSSNHESIQSIQSIDETTSEGNLEGRNDGVVEDGDGSDDDSSISV